MWSPARRTVISCTSTISSKFLRRGAQSLFDPSIFHHHFFGLLDGGGLALDVREHRIDLRSLAQDLRFHGR